MAKCFFPIRIFHEEAARLWILGLHHDDSSLPTAATDSRSRLHQTFMKSCSSNVSRSPHSITTMLFNYTPAGLCRQNQSSQSEATSQRIHRRIAEIPPGKTNPGPSRTGLTELIGNYSLNFVAFSSDAERHLDRLSAGCNGFAQSLEANKVIKMEGHRSK